MIKPPKKDKTKIILIGVIVVLIVAIIVVFAVKKPFNNSKSTANITTTQSDNAQTKPVETKATTAQSTTVSTTAKEAKTNGIFDISNVNYTQYNVGDYSGVIIDFDGSNNKDSMIGYLIQWGINEPDEYSTELNADDNNKVKICFDGNGTFPSQIYATPFDYADSRSHRVYGKKVLIYDDNTALNNIGEKITNSKWHQLSDGYEDIDLYSSIY